MRLQTAVLLGLMICLAGAEYPVASPYPAAKYPPAGTPDPGPGSGPAPTGPSGPTGSGPSGPGPSGPGPSGPGPFGPGPSGPGPFGPGPGPFGPGPFSWGGPGAIPFGPYPPPFGPYPPHFGPYPPGTLCGALERLRARAIRVTRPLVAGSIGAGLLWMAKQIIIPNMAVFASSIRRRMGFDEDSALDRMATEVSRAVSNGACMEKVACALGKATARNYPAATHIARVIDPKSTGFLENFTAAFQRYVSGDESDCQALQCPSS